MSKYWACIGSKREMGILIIFVNILWVFSEVCFPRGPHIAKWVHESTRHCSVWFGKMSLSSWNLYSSGWDRWRPIIKVTQIHCQLVFVEFQEVNQTKPRQGAKGDAFYVGNGGKVSLRSWHWAENWMGEWATGITGDGMEVGILLCK